MWTSPSTTKETLFVVSRRYLVNEHHCLGRVSGGKKAYLWYNVRDWKPARLPLPWPSILLCERKVSINIGLRKEVGWQFPKELISQTSMRDHLSWATTSHNQPPIQSTKISPVKS